MFCKNCGYKINKGDTFCEKCGTKVEVNETKVMNLESKKSYIIAIVIVMLILALTTIIFYIKHVKKGENEYKNKTANNIQYNDNNIEGSISETVQNNNMFSVLTHNYEYNEASKTLRIYGKVKNIATDRYDVSVRCNIYNEVYKSVTKSSPKYLLDIGEECDYEIIYTYTDYKPVKYQISSFDFVHRPDYTSINNLSNSVLNDTKFKIISHNWENDVSNKKIKIYGKVKNITSEKYVIRIWSRILGGEENVIKENLISDEYTLEAGQESDFEILFDYNNYGSIPVNYQILSVEYYVQ